MNNVFGRLLNEDLSLIEFMSHFETAMETQRFTQKNNDHNSWYKPPLCGTSEELEKHAARVYTHNIYLKVREEINASIGRVMSKFFTENENRITYDIIETDGRKKGY